MALTFPSPIGSPTDAGTSRNPYGNPLAIKRIQGPVKPVASAVIKPVGTGTSVANATSNYSANGSDPYSSSASRINSRGGGAVNQDDINYLNDEESFTRSLLDSARRTLENGLTSINDSYNKEQSSANSQRSRALEDYGIQRDDTTRKKGDALGKVDTNARTLSNSVRRLLGMASGSDSTAFNQTAPDAVARLASGERTNVLGDFGENFRALDLSEKRATDDFAALLEDLAAQRNQRESGLRGDIIEREQGINSSLAEIARQRALLQGGGYTGVKAAMQPYKNAISGGQSQLDSLFEKYRTPYSVKPVVVEKPELRDYTVDRANIAANQQAGTTDDPYSYFRRKRADEAV